MFENKNQLENFNQLLKRNLFLSSLSAIFILLSLTVFYPMEMKADKYSNDILTIVAYAFYGLQTISFALVIVTFINGISLQKTNRHYLNYLTLLISLSLFAVFGYELY